MAMKSENLQPSIVEVQADIQMVKKLEDDIAVNHAAGEYKQALEKLEILQSIVRTHYGTQSKEFTGTCVQICNIANQQAIQSLKDGNPHEALQLLRHSEELAENNEKGLALTYNNLACYYRKQGHLRSALIYLEKALELEANQSDSASKADTHLNTCAVLSQLGRHDLAMFHAHQAIMIIQAQLLMHFMPNRDKKKQAEQDIKNAKINAQLAFKDRVAVLTIAYHNLGVEQEFLKQYQQAVESYRNAMEFAQRYLGKEDGITQNMTQIYNRAKNEIESQIGQQRQREEVREVARLRQAKLMSTKNQVRRTTTTDQSSRPGTAANGLKKRGSTSTNQNSRNQAMMNKQFSTTQFQQQRGGGMYQPGFEQTTHYTSNSTLPMGQFNQNQDVGMVPRPIGARPQSVTNQSRGNRMMMARMTSPMHNNASVPAGAFAAGSGNAGGYPSMMGGSNSVGQSQKNLMGAGLQRDPMQMDPSASPIQ